MQDFKREIALLLAEQLPEGLELDLEEMIEVPPKPEMGDYAFPCFKLAKYLRKNPVKIAEELKEKLEPRGVIADIQQIEAYINFFIKKSEFSRQVLDQVLRHPDDYGSQQIGANKTIVIDFSSPNIAKPFNIGHLRSTVIGGALKNIFEYLGYEVQGINFLGDWGTQFGKVIYAYKLWGNKVDLSQEPIKQLLKLYVKFHEEAEKNPELDEEARAWFRRLEEGNPEARKLWEKFRKITIDELKKIYDRMGIEFDEYSGESFYSKKADEVAARLEEMGLLQESEGAMIVDLSEYDMPPFIVKKKDGTTLYAVRDLAAAIDRYERFGFTQSLYVVGQEQTLHFKQVFKVLELMGYEWANRCVHVPFGLYLFSGEKMSTRKGKVIFLEEVLDEAVSRVREVIEEKNPGLEEKDKVAEMVGVGAVFFADLKNTRIKNVPFDYDKILSFEGETGPYLQYTHARITSLLKKGEEQLDLDKIDFDQLKEPEEMAVIKTVGEFPAKIQEAAQKLEPSIIAKYLISLAAAFNTFYNAHRIITDDLTLTRARLALALAVKITLRNGLKLLGIKAPDQM
ncbi:arginine--tRNA ligase [Anoxybacter fermentans]|uniref:Arginine--tRNA ligase n=1 Tax=Anoxybacter fermentans TaxID=1323375 RepID=A0A3Q9HS68_9FIRM|nr:arginine--tRNA ligase [Anoxybacter fermentans]AZR74187.1 arginine--tRNA ligase [Anoxybacter fermentans]